MTRKEIGMMGKGGQFIGFVLVGIIMSVLFSSGCTKEKKVVETKALGCTTSDNLPAEVTKKAEVNFENKIKLLGTSIKKLSSDQIEVSYFWQVTGKLDRFKNIYVHFADKSNNVLFQNDHEFCPKKTFEELKGKVVKEVFVVGVPQAAKGKEISLKLGVYVPEPNGPRLKVESAGDAVVDEKNTRAAVDKITL